MKELDLMYALEGVEDEILRDAERFELRPRRRVLTRIAAAAAAAVLLCGTVYAAVASVKAGFNGDTWIEHREETGVDVLYSDMEVAYKLAQQELPAETMAFLEDYLDRHWQASWNRVPIGDSYMGIVVRDRSFLAGSSWDLDDAGQVHRPEGLESHYFRSLEEAEDFFDMPFALPECIRTAAPVHLSQADEPGILLEVLTPPLADDTDQAGLYLGAISAEAAAEQIVPGYAQLRFRIADPVGELSGISGSVILALNGDAAAEELVIELSMALDYLGEPEFRELDVAGLDGSLLVFLPCDTDPGAVHAWYTCNGVGYVLHAYVKEGVQIEDPAQLLLPMLEELN